MACVLIELEKKSLIMLVSYQSSSFRRYKPFYNGSP